MSKKRQHVERREQNPSPISARGLLTIPRVIGAVGLVLLISPSGLFGATPPPQGGPDQVTTTGGGRGGAGPQDQTTGGGGRGGPTQQTTGANSGDQGPAGASPAMTLQIPDCPADTKQPADFTLDDIRSCLVANAMKQGDFLDGAANVEIDITKYANPGGSDFCSGLPSDKTTVPKLMRASPDIGYDNGSIDHNDGLEAEYEEITGKELAFAIYPKKALIDECEKARIAAKKIGPVIIDGHAPRDYAVMNVPISARTLTQLHLIEQCFYEEKSLNVDPAARTPNCKKDIQKGNYRPASLATLELPKNWKTIAYNQDGTGGVHYDELKTYMLEHANPPWNHDLIELARKNNPAFAKWWDDFDKAFDSYRRTTVDQTGKTHQGADGHTENMLEVNTYPWFDKVGSKDVVTVALPPSGDNGVPTLQAWSAEAYRDYEKDAQNRQKGGWFSRGMDKLTGGASTSVGKGVWQAMSDMSYGLHALAAESYAKAGGVINDHTGMYIPGTQAADHWADTCMYTLDRLQPIFNTLAPYQVRGEPWDSINKGIQFLANQGTNIGAMMAVSGALESVSAKAITSYVGSDADKVAAKEFLGAVVAGGSMGVTMAGSTYAEVLRKTGDKNKALEASWITLVMVGGWSGKMHGVASLGLSGEEATERTLYSQSLRLAKSEEIEATLKVLAKPSIAQAALKEGITMGVNNSMNSVIKGDDTTQVITQGLIGFAFGSGFARAGAALKALPETKAFKWTLEKLGNGADRANAAGQIMTGAILPGTYVNDLPVTDVTTKTKVNGEIKTVSTTMTVVEKDAAGNATRVMDPRTGSTLDVGTAADGTGTTAGKVYNSPAHYVYGGYLTPVQVKTEVNGRIVTKVVNMVVAAAENGKPTRLIDPSTGRKVDVGLTDAGTGYVVQESNVDPRNRAYGIVQVDANGHPIPGAPVVAAPLGRLSLNDAHAIAAPRLAGGTTSGGPAGNNAGGAGGGAAGGAGRTANVDASVTGNGTPTENSGGGAPNVEQPQPRSDGEHPDTANREPSSPDDKPPTEAEVKGTTAFQKAWLKLSAMMDTITKPDGPFRLKITPEQRVAVEGSLVLLEQGEKGSLTKLYEKLGAKPFDAEWLSNLLKTCMDQEAPAAAANEFDRAFPEFAQTDGGQALLCSLPTPNQYFF